MVFAWVSAGFRRFRAGFSICGRFSKVFPGFLRFPADLFGRLAGFSFFSGNSETSSQQKLETEKSYHGHCAVLRQILYICRDRFWSHKRWKFRYRFEGGPHGNTNFCRKPGPQQYLIKQGCISPQLAWKHMQLPIATFCIPKNKLEKPFQKRLRWNDLHSIQVLSIPLLLNFHHFYFHLPV